MVIVSVLAHPMTEPVSLLWLNTLSRLKPSGLYTPPLESLIAVTRQPSLARRSAVVAPTLPHPCTTTVASCGSMHRCLADIRALIIDPRPVASNLPLLPPISSGLPVTTAGTEYPLPMLYVSMIQAIT